MTLVETGTRGLLGAVFGPTAEGETSYAATDRRTTHSATRSWTGAPLRSDDPVGVEPEIADYPALGQAPPAAPVPDPTQPVRSVAAAL
jgi:hypothetical protein